MSHSNADPERPLERLTAATLPRLRDTGVQVPTYARRSAPPGVVHLGLGAFHRAHQAMVFDTMLQRGDARWAVLAAAMRSIAVAAALDAQEGLYSVQLSGADERRWRVVGSIARTCVVARDAEEVVAAIAAPTTRWITLTVTEKGYTADLAALIVRGLSLRRAAALQGLTIASCDNVVGNGAMLAALCREAAEAAALRAWIDARCAFPNSMVDRIVPAADDRCRADAARALGVVDEAALATESFWDWTIEERFADAGDAAALRSAGVAVVDDVRPFEAAKLRLLNGSHSTLAAIGAVLGVATVAECMARPAVASFLHRLMTREVMPHLARPQLAEYRDALLARFANPALQHRVHQIATDFSQKIPQRWVPSILAQQRAGGDVAHLALAAATWIRYCGRRDEGGAAYELNDPLAATLAAPTRHDDDATRARALLGLVPIWGEALAADAAWQARVLDALERLRRRGLEAALAETGNDAPT